VDKSVRPQRGGREVDQETAADLDRAMTRAA
jgi:hypothetical protein